jgi:D-3-phosphoglycerate dehydrogenase
MAMILANDGVDQRCRRKLESSGDVVVENKLSHEELKEGLAKEFDCIIVRSATNLTEEVIQANTGGGSKLKLLIRAGVGLDNIDTTFAESVGLIVRNTPNASTNSVVEMTISHLLCGSRNIISANLDMKNGKWTKKNLVGSELGGKNLGLVGYGRIARGVARIASTLGMNPHAYDPFVDPKLVSEDGVVYHDTVESLFSNCTHISVHCSKTKETESMVNKDLISLMPHRSPSGIECGRHVVNCARGGIINEHDMLELLDSGFVSSLGLDVFANEPEGNLALSQHRNVTSTPHIGASTLEAQRRIGDEIVAIIESTLR